MTQARQVDADDLLTSLLREVSRSFYLTLRVLPRAVRPQIGLAYLLARATDTIADTDVVPVAQRLEALARLRRGILEGLPGETVSFEILAGSQSLPAERVLLERAGDALTVLRGLAAADQQRIRGVLSIITSGQELDLRRFDGAGESRIIALERDTELEDYTYRVAGCVGEFWTRMCVAHLFPAPPKPDSPSAAGTWFEESGVQFGKGLQLVNILRDLPRDLRHGRCYLPAQALAKAGLKPEDLLDPANERRLRRVYDGYVDRAERYLKDGWEYTCAIPRGFARLRLACAWPVLIGARTLAALRRENVLDPSQRIKVSRAEVRRILLRTIVALPSRRAWRRVWERTAGPRTGRWSD